MYDGFMFVSPEEDPNKEVYFFGLIGILTK